jgi:hypothetical protein
MATRQLGSAGNGRVLSGAGPILRLPGGRLLSRVFLSHSSADNAQTIALRDWLVGEGWSDLFVDVDPKRGIAPGYDDVLVTGGVLASAPKPLILSQEGKLRAEGILTLNVHHGNGVNSFVQADLRGGEGLFGATGKVGARVAW